MVTVNKKIAANTGTATFELLGLSTDQKPTGTFSGYKVSENSVYMELDTGDIYYFNGGEWKKMSTNGQSGSSITVDDALDLDSANPVQNKVIAAALANKANTADLKEPLIVHGTWNEGGSSITVDITNSGYTLADIYAAAQAGRAVYLEYTEDGTTTRMGLGTRAESNGEYVLGFSIGAQMQGKPVVGTVDFDNSLVGNFNIAVEQ